MVHKKSAGSGNAKAVVLSLAGLTAAAVGAYYLYGSKDATKNRAKVKGWMLKAKGEVLEKLEDAQEVTESAYMSAVDSIAKKYNSLKTIEPSELEAFITDMKGHWAGISKKVKSVTKPKVKKGKK
ncbi:MAG: hypothetical protein RLZZ67_306 [Candidatus Parcubacteria bacterium]|jgi:hypothetical protein